jgi:AraC-like DNA-binding protein
MDAIEDILSRHGPCGLGPCIYFGRFLSARRRRERQRGAAIDRACNLWLVTDGSLQVDGCHAVRPGQVALTDAGAAVVVAARTRVYRVACDLVARPREFYERTYHLDTGAPRHPSWRELFGCSLPVPLPDPWARTAGDLIRFIVGESWRDPWARLRATARLHAWVVDLATALATDAAPRLPDAQAIVRRADELIAEHHHHGLTVAELAERMDLSRSYLAQVYARLRGRGPGAAITARRLERAAEFLRGTDASVDDIGRRVGFSGGRALARAFRRAHNESPTAYRRRHRTANED